MLKTSTTIKLRYAQKFLKSAHETLTEAIVNDPEFAAFAMKNPKNKDVELFITAMLKINAAGKKLEELLEQYD
jgi:hypothetical protein